MPQIIKLLLLLSVFTNLINPDIYAEEKEKIKDKVFDEKIKSVRLHQKGWELSYPYIKLNRSSKIVLSFDDLQEEPRDFKYTIIHCSKEWERSDLFFSDYIDGFEKNPLRNYEMSVNTMIPYTHYKLELPNEDIKFRESGNYAVLVYDDINPENPVLIKRFLVVEQNIKINANVKQPVMSLYKTIGQDIKFNLKINSMDFNNVMEEIDVKIVQNFQWEVAQTDFQPDFMNNDKIVFNRDDQAVFKGINEYRMFSTRELKYTDKEIAGIKYDDPDYYVKLYPDKSRQFKKYLDRDDFNGRYAISNREGWESITDSDYTKVKFSLPTHRNLTPDKVYLYGELTNWSCNENSEMKLNTEKMQYEKTLLLKQGVYNYRYVLYEKEKEKFNHMRFEGSHWETENDYMIIVYYRDRYLGADRIIGFDLINSVNK